MKSRAAVAWEAGKPLVIEEVEVGAPQKGEVLLEGRRDRRLPHRRLHHERPRSVRALSDRARP